MPAQATTHTPSANAPSANAPSANAAVLAVCVFALFLFSARTLADSDTLWHVAAGQWMLRHGSVPGHDPFGFTTAGLNWVAHEWLAEILFALAYGAAGWGGVVILSGAAAAAAFWLMGRALERYLPPWPAYGLLLTALLCLATSMLARPHVLALPVMVGWTIILVHARAAGTAPGLPWAALMAVWANLHGGFMGGLVLAAALAGEAFLAGPDRRGVVRGWGLFLALAILAAMLTPHGPFTLLFPLHMMGLHAKSGIQEWEPPNFQGFEPLEIILMAALFLGLTGRVRLPWYRVLIFLGLVHAALAHTRFQLQLAVMGFILLAPALGAGIANTRALPARPRHRENLLLVTMLLALAAARLAAPLAWAEGANAPHTALAALPAELRGKPVLNDYHLGGFLIFHAIPPFIDSRADLYGNARLVEFTALQRGDEATIRAVLARHGIVWTLLAPGTPLAGWFDRQPDWQRHYADGHVVLHRLR